MEKYISIERQMLVAVATAFNFMSTADVMF